MGWKVTERVWGWKLGGVVGMGVDGSWLVGVCVINLYISLCVCVWYDECWTLEPRLFPPLTTHRNASPLLSSSLLFSFVSVHHMSQSKQCVHKDISKGKCVHHLFLCLFPK